MSRIYEAVIGLEVHIELKTGTKIFCACPTDFGAEPNTQCCPVCAGLPGTLPMLNKKVVEYAVKAGLATNCEIARYARFDRKNYFYPDLPKAYQISQYDMPLCERGHILIATGDGEKRIGITRIHIEEDAAKLVHDDRYGTLIDLNRAGIPLIEVVSEPDMRSAAEAVAYLKKLRSIVLYAGISDAKMNEGSMRCDVNISVRVAGEDKLGTRIEIKNLNSFVSVQRAVEYEFRRQVAALEAGESLIQETRRFEPSTGRTFSMRVKEDADDYRYFPEPDIPPIILDNAAIKRISASIPPLPDERRRTYMEKFGLSAYHSEQLVLERSVSDFFDAAAALTEHRQILASFILSEVLRYMGEGDAISVSPAQIAAIADMLGSSRINGSGAKKLLGALWGTEGDPAELISALDLEQLSDRAALAELAKRTIAQHPNMVRDYKIGKQSALKALMGRAMSISGGKANPEILRELIVLELEGQ